jgi:DSF synthase
MLTLSATGPHPTAAAVISLPTLAGGRQPARGEAADRLAPRLAHLEVRHEAETGTLWSWMRPTDRPSFTPELMADIRTVQRAIERRFAADPDAARRELRYFVLGSRVPGIYSLGGDLGYFVRKIRARDRAAMRQYAHAAIEAVHRNHVAFGQPMVTIALVEGDALGGGFECALSLDVIVAERSAKLGLPEILFNLFPGMGAYSFLSRRLDAMRAEQLIRSGRIHSGEELHAMGLVDVLAEDGHGHEAVRGYIERHGRKHTAHQAIYRARRRVNPITLDELRDVVDIWVDAAMTLEEPDLRKMERLRAAQDRRFAEVMAPLSVAAE